MGNMTITDGRTGSPHITAAEVWAANVGIWGDGDRLLFTGQNMRAQIINNNTVRIYDGVVSLQGLRCGIPYGQYIDMTIQNGTAGQKRRDAIYIEYTYNPTLRTMDTDLKVKKGAPGTNYVSPTLQTGDIAGGALTHEGLLYYVDIDGITISKVEGKMQPPARSVVETNAGYPAYTSSYRWVKYSDGMAVVEWGGAITLSAGTPWAGGYHHTQAAPASFPFAFVSAPKVVSAIRTGGKLAMWCGGPITATTFLSVWFDGYSGSYSGGAFDNVYLRFEGPWK